MRNTCTKKQFLKNSLKVSPVVIGLALSTSYYFGLLSNSSHAIFQEAYVRLDRMNTSQATGGLVCARPNTVATEADVQVTFPALFTVNSTAANWIVGTSNLPAGATAWVGIDDATDVTGQTVTFTSGELAVGTTYCFTFASTSTLTNPGATASDRVGSITTRTSGLATVDSSDWATATLSSDQIEITATVPSTFSFSLSNTTDTFTSNLSSSAVVSTNGRTANVATNAQNGWIAWVRSANAGLTSAITGETIATIGSVDDTPSALSTGSNGYVLDVAITQDSATGDGTVSQAAGWGAEYDGNATSGGTLSANFQPIARSNGTTDGDILTLTARATISAVTAAAADYKDILTVVAAGRF